MRRKRTDTFDWPVWLREFVPADWPGDCDVERAWEWSEAALRFHRDWPGPATSILTILRHVRTVRDTRRVHSESGLSRGEWKARRDNERSENEWQIV